MHMLDGGGWGVGAFQIVSSIIPVRFGMLGFSSLKCIENLKPFCLVLKIF
jgi:hypothetical protein